MLINLPVPNFKPLSFERLTEKLNQSTLQLRQGSNTRSTTYRKDVEKFEIEWIVNQKPFQLTNIELRSVSMYLLQSRKAFLSLVERDLHIQFSQQLAQSDNVTNHKRLIELTLQYYQLLQDKEDPIMQVANALLEKFSGRNIALNEYKKNLPDLYSPAKMLSKYGTKEDVQRHLNLSVDGDYYKTILILNLVAHLESLNDGEEDQTLFEDIKAHKDFVYDDELHVGEYVVRVLIKKMRGNNIASDLSKWTTFIIELLGDPRTVSFSNAHNVPWERVGREYKDYLVGLLSREDLNLFLEALSNPEHDEIYRYRKQFWKQFSEYVLYAKIFITKNDLFQLDDNFRRRFNGQNSSYSKISDTNRSCIYIDLGEVKIIEGTNNAKIRIYSQSPVNLDRTYYDYQDFYNTPRAQDNMITEIVHRGSGIGSWQNNVLTSIKQLKNVNINLRDTLIK